MGSHPHPIGWSVARLGRALFLVLALLSPSDGGGARAQGLEVDLALVLAVDCSYSVDSNEFRLQMRGLADAFRRPAVQNAIAEGEFGRIAVVLVQWSDDRNQLVAIPWTIVAGREHAERFAARIDATPRNLAEGGTAIGTALQYSAAVVLSAPVLPKRRVIDLSADGRNNRGVRPSTARDEIVARGVTINGLAIINEWPTLDKYFENQVVGGPGNFVIVANDYEAYAEAIYRKLLKEITGPGIS
jgi:hypothetical protein